MCDNPASRPATGQRELQQPLVAPAATANSVFQQPPRSSRSTAEQDALQSHASNPASTEQRATQRTESGHQSSRTVPKSRASQPAQEFESSELSSSENDNDSEIENDQQLPPASNGVQQPGPANPQAARLFSHEMGCCNESSNPGWTERQSAVDAVRAFTGRRSEEDTITNYWSNGYQGQHNEQRQ